MSIYNDLSIEAYSGSTLLPDIGGDWEKAREIRIEKAYPGGLYGPASFASSRRVADRWALNGATRMVIANGQDVAYEGYVDDWQGLEQGGQCTVVSLTGGWGHKLLRQGIRRLWADQRLGQDVWGPQTEALGVISNVEKLTVNVDRETGLRLTPQSSQAWGTDEYYALRYTSPTGETIAKVSFTWKFAEGSQAWTASLYDVTNASTLWSQAATDITGTAANITLSPVASAVEFRLTSNAAQTTPNDQSVYMYIYSLTVYQTTSSITAANLVLSVQDYFGDINADESQVSANTLDLTPFTAERWEMGGNVLTRIARFGDASFNPWAAYLRESESATTPNGEPVLVYEQQPALTDHTYVVSRREVEAQGVTVRKDYSQIVNWIVVEWQGTTGRPTIITPSDDANLTDATSTANYGRRLPQNPLRFANMTQTMAVSLARRYLAQWKDPQYLMSGPISVREYVRGKGGIVYPASLVRPGRNLLIEDYVDDISSDGVRLRISRTSYTHDNHTVQMQSGPVDDMAARLAQLELPDRPGDIIYLR